VGAVVVIGNKKSTIVKMVLCIAVRRLDISFEHTNYNIPICTFQ